MSTKNSHTLVVVTCISHRWNFELLCRSMCKFLEPCNFIIIINEDTDIKCKNWNKWYQKYIKKFLNKFNVTVLNKKDIFYFDFFRNHPCGWTDQNILKICVANLIDTKFYVVLDSKNFFTNKLSLNEIKQVKPQNISWTEKILENWVKICCQKFNVNYTGPENFNLTPNITPYIIKTKLMRKMIKQFGNCENLYNWFWNTGSKDFVSPSEFFMFEIFTKSINQKNTNIFCTQNVAAIWKHHLDQKIDIINDINSQFLYFDVKVSGIHSQLNKRITENDVKTILQTCNLHDQWPSTPSPFLKKRINTICRA